MSYVLLLFYVYVNWFFILLFLYSVFFFFFFFFQAEDGIRDKLVTGVQTCALPISRRDHPRSPGSRHLGHGQSDPARPLGQGATRRISVRLRWAPRGSRRRPSRSEERRVGKECRSRGSPDDEKKKRKVKR